MTASRETPAMLRPLLLFLLLAPAACHGMFGGRTTDEDQELNNFAEARQRAATYYDGGDYVRAAAQYEKALQYRPDQVAVRLGFAYSLMYTNIPSNLGRAQEEFEKIGKLRDPRQEVKRVYGLALTHRTLASKFDGRSRVNYREGRLKVAEEDRALAREHATQGIALFTRIFEIDEALAASEISPQRVSASLTPDAHAGIAHCEIVLADAENLDHLERAIEHIEVFSQTAGNARRFWEQRRERVLVVDPMREGQQGDPGASTLSAQERALYEQRIARTIQEEVTMRRALVETYSYLNFYKQMIDECTRILELDPTVDEIHFLRGRAYALLEPPDYRSALADLREYRSRQDLTKLTEELVGLNRRIQDYEHRLKEEERRGP